MTVIGVGRSKNLDRLEAVLESGGESLAGALEDQDTLRECREIAEKIHYDHGDMRQFYLAELVEKLTGRRPW